MSNPQSQPRVRRITSPSLKTGPMRATHPFGWRQGNSPTTVSSRSAGGRKNSPSSSPTPIGRTPASAETLKKNPRSPDHRASPDRAGSPFINMKDKSRARHSPMSVMKRTSSLDTITTPYLKGEWPREPIIPHSAFTQNDSVPLTAEQSTQTPEEWDEPFDRKKKGSHIRSTSLGNSEPPSKKETLKARLAKSKEVTRSANCTIPHTSPVQGYHPAVIATSPPNLYHSKAVNIPQNHIPKPTIHMRSSVEGLSQEIETLVLNSTEKHELLTCRPPDPTPDGHRAPVAELLCPTRSVDTQTPAIEERLPYFSIYEELKEQEEGRNCSSGGSNSSPCSVSPPVSRSLSESSPSLPIIPGSMDTSRPSSLCDNIDIHKQDKECDSPNLKSIFTRQPPDGCERIKIIQEENGSESSAVKRGPSPQPKDLHFCPIKKPSERYSIPSEVSAFCPLLKPYVQQPSEMALRSSPNSVMPTIEGQ